MDGSVAYRTWVEARWRHGTSFLFTRERIVSMQLKILEKVRVEIKREMRKMEEK